MCEFVRIKAKVNSTARHGREGRGQQSSLALKTTWTKKWLAENS